MDPDEYKSYKESFDAFDWNNNGKISYTSLQVIFNDNDDLLHYSVTLYVQQQKIKKSMISREERKTRVGYEKVLFSFEAVC